MIRIEEMVAIAATAPQAMRRLLTISRWREWQAPDVAVASQTATPILGPGTRFRLEVLGGLNIEYIVEAVSDREVVFTFDGPWRGRERWSFVPDGSETIVRRTYEVEESPPLGALAWRTTGWAVVSAHYKFELARFRATVERDPGPRGEIEPASAPPPADVAPDASAAPASKDTEAPLASPPPSPSSSSPFPVDEG